MYIKYSLGFLVASLIQAGIVALAEFLNISSLNVKITASQLLIHILAGQIAGYILLFIVKKLPKDNLFILGNLTFIIILPIPQISYYRIYLSCYLYPAC